MIAIIVHLGNYKWQQFYLIKFALNNDQFQKIVQFVSTTGMFSCFERNYCRMSLKTIIALIDVILSMAYSAYSEDCIGPESTEKIWKFSIF